MYSPKSNVNKQKLYYVGELRYVYNCGALYVKKKKVGIPMVFDHSLTYTVVINATLQMNAGET